MERLLLVDDDGFSRMLTKDILENEGFEVGVAENGESAWSVIDREPGYFDLLLLDKDMPGLDGFGLLKRIKADGRFKDLPVVMLTGASGQEDIVEGLAAGAHYYLTKPSAREVLKAVVNNALEFRRTHRELAALAGRHTGAFGIMRRAEFAFRDLQEAKTLALWLANASMRPERSASAFAELLVNAVEHGNLNISYAEKTRLLQQGLWLGEVEKRLRHPDYAERWVEVTMERSAADCIVTIKDQGDGFDWANFLDLSPERAFDLNGRGIALARMTGFDSLEYLGNGNTVRASIRLPADSGGSN